MATITQPEITQTDMAVPTTEQGDNRKTTTKSAEAAVVKPALTAPITIALSRDELLVVLGVLSVETIPGIDVEPTGDWSDRERGIANMVAVRSLRARALVQLNAGREPQFHTDLLTAVGACAHSQSAAFLYHWPVRDSAPIRTFGHICGSDFVLHARLDDELHLFTLVPSKAELLGQLLSRCGIDESGLGDQNVGEKSDEIGDDSTPSSASAQVADTKASGNYEFRLTAEQFSTVRSTSTFDEASQYLIQYGVEAAAAGAFATTLLQAAAEPTSDVQQPSRISILQTIQQTEADTVIKRDFTVLEDADQRWLIAAETSLDETLPLVIKSVAHDELLGLLEQWL